MPCFLSTLYANTISVKQFLETETETEFLDISKFEDSDVFLVIYFCRNRSF